MTTCAAFRRSRLAARRSRTCRRRFPPRGFAAIGETSLHTHRIANDSVVTPPDEPPRDPGRRDRDRPGDRADICVGATARSRRPDRSTRGNFALRAAAHGGRMAATGLSGAGAVRGTVYVRRPDAVRCHRDLEPRVVARRRHGRRADRQRPHASVRHRRDLECRRAPRERILPAEAVARAHGGAARSRTRDGSETARRSVLGRVSALPGRRTEAAHRRALPRGRGSRGYRGDGLEHGRPDGLVRDGRISPGVRRCGLLVHALAGDRARASTSQSEPGGVRGLPEDPRPGGGGPPHLLRSRHRDARRPVRTDSATSRSAVPCPWLHRGELPQQGLPRRGSHRGCLGCAAR